MRSRGRTAAGPPEISVVIPTYERSRELESCLAGYAEQSVPAHRYEVVVVDDGSATDLRPVVRRFARRLRLRYLRREHVNAAAARNAGLALASAPLVILGEDDVRPLPSLVGYCLDFHAAHPDESDAVLLRFTLDPALRTSPLLYYLMEQRALIHPFPPQSGIYGWNWFWGGATSCKRSLFRHGLFDPGLGRYEDTELGLRLWQRAGLRIHYEPFPQATMTRRLTVEQLLAREYSGEYHRRLMVRRVGRRKELIAALGGDQPLAPDQAIADEATLSGLVDGIRQIEVSLAGVNPRFAPPGSPLPLLFRLYEMVIAHARARGWDDADLGRPLSLEVPPPRPAPPLTVGPAFAVDGAVKRQDAARAELRRVLLEAELRLGRAPSVLDWNSGLDLAARLSDHIVVTPPCDDAVLPYLDGTLDVVVMPAGRTLEREARRVATAAIVALPARARLRSRLSVRWMRPRPEAPPASIVVDAGSARGRAARLRALRATLPGAGEQVIVAPPARRRGLAAARNRAAAKAKSEVLVFVSAGVRPQAGWLMPLLRLLRDDPEEAIAGPAAPAARSPGNPRRAVDGCPQGVLAVRRELFVAAGGFGGAAQDPERNLCLRLVAHGYRVFEEPRCAVAAAG